MTDETLQMPDVSTTSRPKRVLLVHRTGRLAGLSQILGTTDDAPKPLPAFVGEITRPGDQPCAANLISVSERTVTYLEQNA